MQVWVDLNGIQLSEAEDGTWIHALSITKFKHPIYGVIDITADRVKRFADSVKNKVRGTDPDIDYDHKVMRRDAAGWVLDAEAKLSEPDSKLNGLWLKVKFTGEATQKLADKAYRYFSADFDDEWTDPVTSKVFKDVLNGGALTNRPFLKNLTPINLAEVFGEDIQPKGSSMDPKVLRESLGLGEDATDEQVLEAAKAAKTAADAVPPKTEETQNETQTETAAPTELSEQMKQLSESNPVIKMLLDERAATQKVLSELQEAQRKSNVSVRLSELSSPDAGVVLSPAVLDEAKKFAERPDVTSEVADEMFKMLGVVAKSGSVELSERGATHETQTDASKKLDEAISKIMTDKKVDYTTALSEAVAKDGYLYDAYKTELVGG